MTDAAITDAAIEHVELVRRPVRRVLLGSIRELALVPAIVVLFIVGIFSSPAFFTTANFSNTAQFSAPLGLVVVAESLILLTGSFDLSLQSIYGLAPMNRGLAHRAEGRPGARNQTGTQRSASWW